MAYWQAEADAAWPYKPPPTEGTALPRTGATHFAMQREELSQRISLLHKELHQARSRGSLHSTHTPQRSEPPRVVERAASPEIVNQVAAAEPRTPEATCAVAELDTYTEGPLSSVKTCISEISRVRQETEAALARLPVKRAVHTLVRVVCQGLELQAAVQQMLSEYERGEVDNSRQLAEQLLARHRLSARSAADETLIWLWNFLGGWVCVDLEDFRAAEQVAHI